VRGCGARVNSLADLSPQINELKHGGPFSLRRGRVRASRVVASDDIR